ncbi:hypothetical protein ACFYQA_15245 [Streptomyces sp. NPDC005774]|uniref:hypothetical protein n=1 Tax=Streptomyces sp. NPDC005774 TaxID=3364728 RepID=UPI0036920A37
MPANPQTTEPPPWDETRKHADLERAANMLINADLTGRPARGVTALLEPYAEQDAETVAALNFRRAMDEGCRVAGRAVSLPESPDGAVAVGGYYLSSSVHGSGAVIPSNQLVQPLVTGAFAIRIGTPLQHLDITVPEIHAAAARTYAALVVNSRRTVVDEPSTTLERIADNAHAGHVVVSDTWLAPTGVDLALIGLDLATDTAAGRFGLPAGTWTQLAHALRRSIALFGPVQPGEVVVLPCEGRALELAPDATATLTAGPFGTVRVSHGQGSYEEGFEPLTPAN